MPTYQRTTSRLMPWLPKLRPLDERLAELAVRETRHRAREHLEHVVWLDLRDRRLPRPRRIQPSTVPQGSAISACPYGAPPAVVMPGLGCCKHVTLLLDRASSEKNVPMVLARGEREGSGNRKRDRPRIDQTDGRARETGGRSRRSARACRTGASATTGSLARLDGLRLEQLGAVGQGRRRRGESFDRPSRSCPSARM